MGSSPEAVFRLFQLFDLCHADGTRPAFAAQWFGKQLPCFEQGLRLFCFGAVGQNGEGFIHHLFCFFGIACALNDAGNGKIFCDSLLHVPKFFMHLRQARMCDGIFRVEIGDTHPVFEGFFGITLVEERSPARSAASTAVFRSPMRSESCATFSIGTGSSGEIFATLI